MSVIAQSSDFEQMFRDWLGDGFQSSIEFYLLVTAGITFVVYMILRIAR